MTSAHPIFGTVRTGWATVTSIAAVATNSNNKPLTDVVMDSVRVTGNFLSIEEINTNKTISKVYPNPATSESILDIYTANPSQATFYLHATNGALLATNEMDLTAGKTKIPLAEIGLVNLPNGVYYITVKNGSGVQYHKVSIAN